MALKTTTCVIECVTHAEPKLTVRPWFRALSSH